MRILHITEVLEPAGIESFVMNMYRHMDTSRVQFDFFVTRDQKEYYDDEIARMGGKKYCIDHMSTGNTFLRIIKESVSLYRFLKEHPYEVIHLHTCTPLRALYLAAAKFAGAKTRIIHSHSAEVEGKSALKRLIYMLTQQLIPLFGTHYFACSKAASRWLYPKRIWQQNKDWVFYNGIDTDRFAYTEESRKRYRAELGLDGKYVIVHTGRFLPQKNQNFLVDVFSQLVKQYDDAHLLLLGKGDLRNEVEQKVLQLGLQERITFLGVRSDVPEILCASDCYVMPSLYEGLPVAGVEAQCNGLPCIFSENVTDEVALCKNVTFLSLEQPVSQWADAVSAFRGIPHDPEAAQTVRAAGYDVRHCAQQLMDFYLSGTSRE